MTEVKRRYRSDRVRFAFKPVINWDFSSYQVQALLAAHAEGKFFEMMDAQFASGKPERMSPIQVASVADRIGMDGEAMVRRIDAGADRGTAMAQQADFAAAGARYFPSVYVNGQLVDSQSRTVECLSQLIDDELDS